jgi:hypothetical protein
MASYKSPTVVVRCRPLSNREIHNMCHNILSIDSKTGRIEAQLLHEKETKCFTFDVAYDWKYVLQIYARTQFVGAPPKGIYTTKQ